MRLKSVGEARLVARSVGVDNGHYVGMKVDGRRIEAKIHADSLGPALSSVDDLLAAITVALAVSTAAKARER